MDFLYNIDVNILTYVQEFIRTANLTLFFESMTDLGNLGGIWLAIGVIMLFFKRTRIAGGMVLFALFASVLVDNVVLKNVVQRPRPFNALPEIDNLVKAHGYSFPSGHSGSSFAAAGVIWHMFPRPYGLTALTVAGLIACSRVYLGVHYPSDVIGGALIGLTVAYGINYLYDRAKVRVRV